MSYRAVRKEIAEVMTSGKELLPCSRCREQTQGKMLSDQGGLCPRCFTAYCVSRFAIPARPLAEEKAHK